MGVAAFAGSNLACAESGVEVDAEVTLSARILMPPPMVPRRLWALVGTNTWYGLLPARSAVEVEQINRLATRDVANNDAGTKVPRVA